MTTFRLRAEFSGCFCDKDTDKACLVEGVEYSEPLWIPKSQIDDDSEVYAAGTSGTLIVSEWIATEKGLL